MKFAQLLMKSMIPEWIKLYLNYSLLKNYLSSSALLKKYFKQLKIKFKKKKIYQEKKHLILQQQQIMEKLHNDIDGFCLALKEDLIKIEQFIIWKYQDIQKKNQKIQDQIKIMKKQKDILALKEMIKGKDNKYQNEQNQFKKQQYILKQTLYQFFIELEQYQSFIILNHKGFIKILKKYQKCISGQYRNRNFENENLGEILNDIMTLKQLPQKIKTIQITIEKSLLSNFYFLNQKHGRYHLRKYQEEKYIKGKTIFYFGLFVGFAIVMTTFILLLRIEGKIDPDNFENANSVFQKMFPCFRGVALFIIYYWYLALDLWGWTHFRINYKIYLGFNHHFSTVPEVLRRVSSFSTLFLVIFIFYCVQAENILPFQYHESYTKYLPLIVWFSLIFYVFFPFSKIFNGPGRMWMYKMLAGAIYGHFIKYESRFTFCLDQFISMATPLRDVDYTICYYKTYWLTGDVHKGECFYQYRLTGALVTIVPYSMKAIHYLTRARDKGQFWKTDEMWNFFKTLLAVWVATLSYLAKQDQIYRIIWIPTAALCSIIQYWWDLKKDWLFFETGSNIRFLRNDLGYNHPYIYYIIGISNFFLRLTWILSISPDMYLYFGVENKELFIFMIGFLEMTRRLINNFIKIEKEYITNLRSLKTTIDFQYPFTSKDQIGYQFITDRQSCSEVKLYEDEKYDEDFIQFLRLTNNCMDKSDNIIRKSDQVKTLFTDCKVDMDILEKAKKQEKFQQTKIKELKQQKREFKKIVINMNI